MLIQRANVYRLEPTTEQADAFNQWVGACRFAARNILQASALAVEPPKRTLRRVGKRKRQVEAAHAA